LISPRFLDATSFVDGMARVVIEGPCVYFPEEGCGPSNPRYPGVPESERGKITKAYPPCKFTYIDKSGVAVTKQRFDYGRDFSEGLAPVQAGKLWGFIDRTGTMVIPPKFEDAGPFSSGLSRILVNGRYGYADKSAEIVVSPQFKEAETFSEGLAVVGDGAGRYWYINPRGERSFPGEFALASPFFKGLAHVRLQPRGREADAYIDLNGRQVFRF
jgi:hypothetical protein